MIKSIQRGYSSLSGSDTLDITISSVDISKSFITHSVRTNTSLNFYERTASVRLTSSTNLEIQSHSAPGPIAWEVVEME